jgi:hypothetical protein
MGTLLSLVTRQTTESELTISSKSSHVKKSLGKLTTRAQGSFPTLAAVEHFQGRAEPVMNTSNKLVVSSLSMGALFVSTAPSAGSRARGALSTPLVVAG